MDPEQIKKSYRKVRQVIVGLGGRGAKARGRDTVLRGSLYRLLGEKKDADLEQIKKSYRKVRQMLAEWGRD